MTLFGSRALLTAAIAGASLLLAPAARADGPAAPGYQPTVATKEYTAPLAQQTQPSYVPQSVAMSGPAEIHTIREGAEIPPGYTPVERTRRGMIAGGASLFGSLYLISVLVAAG